VNSVLNLTLKLHAICMLLAVGSLATAQNATVQVPGTQRMTPAVSTQAGIAPAMPLTASGLARDHLRKQASDWMAAQTGASAESIRVGALDGRVDPPNCENGYRFDFPFESRNTIRANCDNPVRQYYLRVSVERPRQRVVLARPMAAGELISPSDLVVREVSANAAGLDNPALLIGRSLRRGLPAGEAPQAGDVEEVASVLRATTDQRAGEAVTPAGFRTELVPRSRLPAGAITRTEDLSRARLRRDVAADSVLISDDLTDTRPVVVAKRNLMRGETIDGASLEVIEMDRRALPADHLTSIQGLEQGEMTGTVRAGEPLRASMLRPALMVRKGQTVMLTVARAGIEISIQVEALEDAKLGDQVKLRNPESGKALAGLVIGRGAVRAL